VPARHPTPVGAHVFTSGGLRAALERARRFDADVVQVFVSNPRGWAPAAGTPDVDAAFREACAADGRVVYVHAPYLVNLGSPTALTAERSVASLRHAVARGAAIGATGVVFHAGSAGAPGRRAASLAQTRSLLLPVLDEAARAGVQVLVEPTAGGGAALAATVDDLREWLDAVGAHDALRVCVDTCHLHAAGHDLGSAAGARRVLDALDRSLPAGLVALVHANDSKDPAGSRRDRHEAIGDGTIGVAPLGELFRHRLTRGVPVLIETPGDDERHRRDVATLKRLRDAASRRLDDRGLRDAS
jgi:deoxyribonuclease-4